jgi:hypothetical protein
MTSEHSDPQAGDPGDLVGLDVASELLGVPEDQVRTMADQGVITAHDGAEGPRFQRAELIAARDLGG